MRHFASLTAIVIACTGSLPEPKTAPPLANAYVEVPFPPPPARAEIVPTRPPTDAVWIDGEWVWRNSRWAWKNGYWVRPPEGAVFSPSTLVRKVDGTLLLAQGIWRDRAGKEIEINSVAGTAEAREGTLVNSEGEIEEPAPNVKTP